MGITVVLLLCSAMRCLSLLCLPPTSSSSLLMEKRQHCLNSLSGPVINKGRDCEQPLLAGCASSSPSRAANHRVSVGLRRNGTGEVSSALLEAVGLGCILVPLQYPKLYEDPEEEGQPWLHKVILKWEQGDKRCTGRGPPSPILLLKFYYFP